MSSVAAAQEKPNQPECQLRLGRSRAYVSPMRIHRDAVAPNPFLVHCI